MFPRFTTSVLLLLGVSSTVMAHMELVDPAPRKSKFNPFYKGDSVDYDMSAPLNDGFSYPCRGYGAGPSVGTYTAGGSVQVRLDGEAPHNGGHCQFSLSVDGGSTFVVMKTVMGDCMIATRTYNVPIPKNTPNGKVVFGWSWINKTGNREYYMNCADITIQGGSGQCISGPKNFIANLPGYPTIPEFTSGGPDGSDYFAKRPFITSCAAGNPDPASNDQPQPKQNPDQYKESQDKSQPQPGSTPTPVPQPQAQPQPEPKQSPSKCEIKCLGGPDYQICGNGGATPFRMKCSPGTSCHIVDGQAGCF